MPCLEQGGYDWGLLAYAVGFGGSMIWFGSSAGVALSNMFPETKSVFSYIKQGWHIIPAYIVGFGILLITLGWHPVEKRGKSRSDNTLLIDHMPGTSKCENQLAVFTSQDWHC
jgi:hypothetical protein